MSTTRVTRVVYALLVLTATVPASLLEATAIQSGSIVGIKRLRSSEDTRKPRKVKRETSYVQICTDRTISEQPPISDNCQAAESGDELLSGEGLRVEKLRRARVLLPLADVREPFVFLPRLFAASGAAVWAPPDAGDVGRGEYELSGEGNLTILDVRSGALIAIDHDAARLKRAGLRVRGAGALVESEHTTWFLGVSGDDEATLVVDSGAVRVLADTLAADSLHTDWGYGAAGVIVEQGSTATWSRSRAPTVTRTQDPALWREAILYNGDEIWDGGGFPWVVVPAVAVPVILCVILCGGDDDGKTGTVTIPIP